jgi:hypothetical protein
VIGTDVEEIAGQVMSVVGVGLDTRNKYIDMYDQEVTRKK